MNKIRKTYAVTGLMEWQCQISTGKARLSILFTGGTLTGFGLTPALYTTDNPIFQRIIEGSDYFKSGRITLYRESDLEEEDPCYQLGAIGEKTEVAEEDGHKEGPVFTGGENSETPNKGKSEIVEVGSLDDAKEYLIEHLGMKSSELRSKKAILEAAAAAGIVFKGDI